MKKPVIISIMLTICLLSMAQSEQEAIKVLEKLSSTAQSAPSVSLKFRIITLDLQKKTSDTIAGNLLMAKDQYRLELPDNITWFNGSVSWNYLVAEKEVTIVRPDRKDDSFLSRPSSIFTLYRNGYKARMVEQTQSAYTIDLYPEETESDIVRIRLNINRNNYALAGAEYKRKDGISLLLSVDDYNLKLKPEAGAFTFNAKNYKGVEIIDMR